MYRFLLFIISCLLIGCSGVKTKSDQVYFGGEIVNPTSEYVILYKGDVVLDSAKLNDQNRFSFTLNSIDEGLHYFDHSPEQQYIYLEKGDSLLVRLNTVDFDESLAFSGQGGEINNFLLEMYLAYEDEETYLNTLYVKNSNDFCKKIDSLKSQKINILSDLKTSNDFSENAIEIAQASIDFNYYIYKEKYPFHHKKNFAKETFKALPKTFYNYRKKLNLNNENLAYYRPYYNYLKYHYGNLSYEECTHDCTNLKDSTFNYFHFYQHKLSLIDNKVKEKRLRDNLFRNIAVDYLLKARETKENNTAFIHQFRHLSSNNVHMKEIDALYANINRIQPNNEVPDVALYCTKGKKTLLKDICKGKQQVVFYFWSGTQKRHFENISRHVKNLEKKYPKKKFVGINVKTDSIRWLSMVNASPLKKSNQFRAPNYDEITHTMALYDKNKGFIVEDGVIIDAFANLYTSF